MKLLQWNIWYKEKPENIVKLLKEIDADIVCLQELTIGLSLHGGVDVVQLVKDELGYEVYFKQMEVEGGYQANGIFSKHPIKSSRFAWINKPTGSGGYDDEYRCYAEATIDLDSRELTVGTTHMSYTHEFKETKRKLKESEQLLAELHNKKNFIFTGDLNVIPESETIAKVSGLLQQASPDYSQPTWTTKPFEYNGFKAETLDWRLDYVFASKDLGIKSSEIINTEYSDHLPILIEADI